MSLISELLIFVLLLHPTMANISLSYQDVWAWGSETSPKYIITTIILIVMESYLIGDILVKLGIML